MLSPSAYINRELSWIEFNRRVLEEACDPSYPPLERAKFLAIFATNLDEFFMIRVAGLQAQLEEGMGAPGPDGLTPEQTLIEIRRRLLPLLEQHNQVWEKDVKPLLASHGVCVLHWSELNDAQRASATQHFYTQIFPILTPLAVDNAHPFPHISNLSLSLAVLLRNSDGRELFARIKIPQPRLVRLENCKGEELCEHCFVWAEQVVAANIGALFPGMEVVGTFPFRVTRDADLEIKQDEASDLRLTVERSLQERRFGDAVRLEVTRDMPAHVRDKLMQHLELDENDVFAVSGELDLSCLWELHRLQLPELKDRTFTPHLPADMAENEDLFARIRQGDALLHHPYESFAPVVNFVRAAARDPNVLAIKQTLYRVGKNSPIVQALIEAATNGKQVAVVVELKARFDEENNIQWARALEEAGVHVVYGFPVHKVHAKVCLVVRRDPDDVIRRYTHLGTGNYNAQTARLYTDLGLFTCDPDIGEDVSHLFNYLTGYSQHREYKKLLVAPITMRTKLAELIEREIAHHEQHGDGHLIFKMNALVDPRMIDLLYRASAAGVRVELIVRGVCSLRPGVPGLSENITVTSIVGRFLEHSRVFYFHNHGAEEIYVGSADLMQRNLDWRVETIFPILDPQIRQRIRHEVLELALQDNVKARRLQPDGCYVRVQPSPGAPRVNSQLKLLDLWEDD